MKGLALLLIVLALADGFAPSFLRTSSRNCMNLVQFASTDDETAAHTSDACDIAVFGGGFGGLYTALAISRDAKRCGKDLDVVLVEPTEKFVFLPLLYDLCVGTATDAEVCPAYKDLLVGTAVRHVRASLDSFDTPDSTRALLTPTSGSAPSIISFRACVVAVGASPTSIMASVPGAQQYALPFYTEADAKKTRRLLHRLEEKVEDPRIAVVGGGFGGVELSASMQRRLPGASVTLLSRGPPMAATRAQPLVDRALERLGVQVEVCTVNAIKPFSNDDDPNDDRVVVLRTGTDEQSNIDNNEQPFDAVLWTAGSGPAVPVANGLPDLRKSPSGRLAMDSTLRCFWNETRIGENKPPVWALGDCADIVAASARPAVPKTAQAAMQQADVVAANLLAQLNGRTGSAKAFVYQDLGTMFTLGGPNAGVMAPREGLFAPFLEPVLDAARGALGVADEMLSAVGQAPVVEQWGLSPETLGLSLGSYGIAGDNVAAPGTLAGTLTGAVRRAVYAARMPTNRQRGVAAVSAAISTAAALAREAADRNKQ